ncbi:hypothetical protein [Micromonospora musae]|uniref:hypothetical protein n=1 Tax=Micromonospora musae TaxID=1894970 RepID=UPI0033F8B8F9
MRLRQRRYAEYGPFARCRPGRYRLFRSVELNAAGWAAAAALCLAGAAVGCAVSLQIDWPTVIGLVGGGLLSLVAIVVADRRRWGGIWTEYSWGAPPETTESVGAKLQQLGMPVETAVHSDGEVHLRYRHRDGRRVAMALS